MDPSANLDEQQRVALGLLDDDSEHLDTGDAVRLAELVLAYFEWTRAGGFAGDIPAAPDADRSAS